MYASLQRLRAEGITEAQANDARLLALSQEATALIDRTAGWWFEPRPYRMRLDGTGTPSVYPSVPPILLETLTVSGAPYATDEASLVTVGSPIMGSFAGARLTLTAGVFPRGRGNVVAGGLWGFTVPEPGAAAPNPLGVTPPAIMRAAVLLVLRYLAPEASAEADDARGRGRLVSERTHDQSYTLAKPTSYVGLTGMSSVDALLAPYRRTRQLGAV